MTKTEQLNKKALLFHIYSQTHNQDQLYWLRYSYTQKECEMGIYFALDELEKVVNPPENYLEDTTFYQRLMAYESLNKRNMFNLPMFDFKKGERIL
jgi:hypothetical protein